MTDAVAEHLHATYAVTRAQALAAVATYAGEIARGVSLGSDAHAVADLIACLCGFAALTPIHGPRETVQLHHGDGLAGQS
jgi:hypothetical protein